MTEIPEKICKYGRVLNNTFRLSGINGDINLELPVALNINNILYNSNITSVSKLDAPNATESTNIFDTCLLLETVKGVNAPNSTKASSIFRSCRSLKTIDKVYFPKATTYTLAFNGCSALTSIGSLDFTYAWKNGIYGSNGLETEPNAYADTGNITHAIYSGSIGSYLIYDRLCELNPLDAESVASLVNCLEAQGQPYTLKLHSTAYKNLTSALISAATSKNWTLVSA